MNSADRHFVRLLACALTALAALSLLAGRGLGRSGGETVASPYTNSEVQVAASAHPTGAVPSRVLQPLLSTSFDDRFPHLASPVAREWPILTDSQIVSYYGNPYSAEMGILGAADPETVVAELERHAAQYDRLNGPTGVVPALHLVYAVAQPEPTDNGLFLQYLGDEDVRRYLALTEEREMLLFLDLQIGRSSVEAEMERVLPYLRYPHVHLAIDPEFAVASPEVPGLDLGSLTANDIDDAQATLQKLVLAEGLPPKLLITHQFADSMVLDAEAIQHYPDVDLVIDMDGFGPAAIKQVKYERYAARPYASHAAIKLFFDYDPDLLSEEDVLSLEPPPAVIIYQ